MIMMIMMSVMIVMIVMIMMTRAMTMMAKSIWQRLVAGCLKLHYAKSFDNHDDDDYNDEC